MFAGRRPYTPGYWRWKASRQRSKGPRTPPRYSAQPQSGSAGRRYSRHSRRGGCRFAKPRPAGPNFQPQRTLTSACLAVGLAKSRRLLLVVRPEGVLAPRARRSAGARLRALTTMLSAGSTNVRQGALTWRPAGDRESDAPRSDPLIEMLLLVREPVAVGDRERHALVEAHGGTSTTHVYGSN
jgi:hypothetical protein